MGAGGRSRLPGLPPLADIDAFLAAAPDHWEAARDALAGGALARWLDGIGETPLAAVAREITSDSPRIGGRGAIGGGGANGAVKDDDDTLRDFLYRAGLDTAPAARRAHDAGTRLARSGRFADAVPLLRRAVRLDPAQPAYAQDLAQALRAGGDAAGAALVLEDALRRHPQQRVLQKQHADLAGAHLALSSDRVDFGTLRAGQSRSATVTLRNAAGGTLEGRVAAAPGWLRVEPAAFTTRQRQRLVLTARTDAVGPAPAEYREAVVLETSGGRREIAVHAAVLPARRALAQMFWWYIPLLVCCLLPALAGWLAPTVIAHRWAHELLPPGMASSALLCGGLFVLTVAADTTWGPRLVPLLLLGLTAWGASPLVRFFADGTESVARLALAQTAIPALVMLILQAVATFLDPRGWGRWPLWAWITAATGALIAYALLHMGVR